MNGGILDAINKRNKAFLVEGKSKDQAELNNYKKLRNMVQNKIRARQVPETNWVQQQAQQLGK